MSKNLTRKGLAFGALVALATSAFAGTPALAADALVLAGDYTSDATLATAVTETYTLNASLAPGSVAANISQLSYKVTNNGAATVVATPYGSAVGALTAGTAVTISASTGNAYVPVTGNNITPSTTVKNDLSLSLSGATAATATQTVTVVAFLDSNSNGIVDSGETQATQTVTFVKYSEIASTTTFVAPTADDTTVTATNKFTNINNQSLSSSAVSAYFTKGDGTDLATAGSTYAIGAAAFTASAGVVTLTTATMGAASASGNAVIVSGLVPTTLNGTYLLSAAGSTTTIKYNNTTAAGSITTAGTVKFVNSAVLQSAVAYSATNAGFKYTTGTVTALVKGTAVKVQPLLNGQAVGTAATSAVTAHVLGAFSGNTVVSTTALAGTPAGNTTAPASGSAAAYVALNSAKQVYFLAKDTATTPAALAGQTVNVSVDTNATLSSTVTLTVNGVTYSLVSNLPGKTGVAKLALTTGADGKAVVSYTTSGFTAGQTVTFVGSDENSTSTVVATEATRNFGGSSNTVAGDQNTGNDYSTYIANIEGNTATTTDGTAVPVQVVVQDQFGNAPADGTYTVTATASS
jgi:hypothetical protein